MSLDAGPQQEILAYLASLDGGSEVAETHISRVVLGRTRAFKLKRPVSFAYLDFSTPRKRLEACQREAELNRRAAPRLYLGARRVTREPDGRLALDGEGELVDAIVEMRRFDSDALLETMAQEERLAAAQIEALARRIATLHDEAEIVAARGGFLEMVRVLALTERSLKDAPPAPAQEIAELCQTLQGLAEKRRELIDARHAQGKTRRCHGDLLLRNICLFEGEPTPFDCIEFSDELAEIDVLYDLAFLLMDLWRLGLCGFSNLALNRYLDRRDEADGLPLLPLFMSLRAAIRAHVAASQSKDDEAKAYFELARRLAREGAGAVIAIGGFSGSGKSSVAAALAPLLGAAPGARSLTSDRIRKKLFGVEATQRLPPQAYEPEVSARVYKTMRAEAMRVAKLGWPVVVDAVFDLPPCRAEIEAEARAAGVPFFGVWLDLSLEARIARVSARMSDASDATAPVLIEQARRDPGAISWRRFESARAPPALAQEIATAAPF
ncbi:MAG TPA: AAA family ATPase [Methylocystis sp.]|nr:AAA family ATPase [Methylocystis sp.]